MEEKKTSRDLTEFFLEWRDTCAIDKCEKSTASGDVQYLHDMFDREFRRLTDSPRVSCLGAGTSAVSEFAFGMGTSFHAFHLVESEFYAPGKKEGSKRFGLPLKNHLFEAAETRGREGRLNGYFLLMLRTVVNNSFDGSVVSDPKSDDGDDMAADPLAKAPATGPAPDVSISQTECRNEFRRLFEAFWKKASKDVRLALLCDVFFVPKLTREIVEASGLGQSAFYNRKPLQKEIRSICSRLADDHDLADIQDACVSCLPELAEEFGTADPECRFFFEIREDLKHSKKLSESDGNG